MRAHTQLYDAETGGAPIGEVTSGAYGPTIEAPMAMGYVPTALSEVGTRLYGEVRGKRLPVLVAEMPFTPANFKR